MEINFTAASIKVRGFILEKRFVTFKLIGNKP